MFIDIEKTMDNAKSRVKWRPTCDFSREKKPSIDFSLINQTNLSFKATILSRRLDFTYVIYFNMSDFYRFPSI